jgi:hypothetical protein
MHSSERESADLGQQGCTQWHDSARLPLPPSPQLVGRAGFNSPRDVTSAIQAALAMLRVPRSALGISAASKGAVAGVCCVVWCR